MIIRTIVGILLGYVIAASAGGLWTRTGPAADDVNLVVAVLIYMPIWIAVWSFAYAFDSTKWTCIGLGAVAIALQLILRLAA